jgi:AcrR family transcriptional regulator
MSPRSKKLSAAMKAESRKAVLAAALEAFARKGFSATTTDEIAKKAGVSKGLIFTHFRTKEEILLTILKEEILRLIPNIDDEDGVLSPRERFVLLMNKWINIVEMEPLLVRLALHLNLDDAYRRLMRRKGKQIMKLYFDTMRSLLVKLGSTTPDLDLYLLNFVFDGITANYAIAPGLLPPISTIKDHLVEVFLSRWEGTR